MSKKKKTMLVKTLHLIAHLLQLFTAANVISLVLKIQSQTVSKNQLPPDSTWMVGSKK
jgi:hypothetical protein